MWQRLHAGLARLQQRCNMIGTPMLRTGEKQPTMPTSLVLLAVAGGAIALMGGYWDDAWHTSRGRDEFFIAPHIALYLGVGLAAGALGLRVILVVLSHGWRTVVSDRPLVLALVGVGVTLASGPIDNAWHLAFGRDAVLWSPPHMLGIVGTLVLGTALLSASRGRRLLQAPIGGLVLAAATFPIAEYETDVPQFDTLWFLPALALGASLAFSYIGLSTDSAGARTRAAAAHLAFMIIVAGLLLALGFEAPALPLLVAPALLLDALEGRDLRTPSRAALFVATLIAAYVPVRQWLGNGVSFGLADVVVGGILAWIAVSVVFAAVERTGTPPRRGTAAAVSALLLLVLPGGASAHDPGQGDNAGSSSLNVVTRDDRIELVGRLRRAACRTATAVEIVARRAGVERRAPLTGDGCSFRGSVDVDGRGRWFVYAGLQDARGDLETWLPVHVGNGGERVADASRFVYRPPEGGSSVVKYGGGIGIYGFMAFLLVVSIRLLRDPSHHR